MTAAAATKATPCGTCPWRAQSQTLDAIENSPRGGDGVHWFDVRNLRKHWRHVASGGMMPCHATDECAHLYGGKRAPKHATSRICVGLCVLARREVHAYLTDGGNYKRYRGRGGARFTLGGLAQWAARLLYPGASFEIQSLDDGMRTFIMPDVDVENSLDVRTPWSDPIQTWP